MQDIRNKIQEILENFKPRYFPGGEAVDTPLVMEQKLWDLVELAMKVQKSIDGEHGEQTT